MTDKQIIIDGVDVHWCEHYTGNIGYLTDKNWTCRAKIQGTKCEDWSNCYFKRWQRKEQECEELKEKVKKYGEINEQDTKDYIELYTKYLKLERILSEIQKQLDDFKLKESFLQSQKARNNFLTRKLNGVFNNLLESDIRVIREMNKISNCEVEE